MSLEEKLLREFQNLPEEKKREVIDFVEFLKYKGQGSIELLMDKIIDDNRDALEELAK
jgi:uncharacterized protein YfbU (UPF0304 family)